MVQFELVIGSDPDTVDAQSLKDRLREELNCKQPLCRLTLQVLAGSTNVIVVMTIPNDGGADGSAAAADAERAANDLLTRDTARLSADLQVDVVYRSPSPSTHHGVLVRIVVAPPPPRPPTAPSPTGSDNSDDSVLIAVGIVVGVFGALGIGGVVAFIALRRRRAAQRNALLNDAASHPQQRRSVAKMRQQPDGTVTGAELAVHAFRVDGKATDRMPVVQASLLDGTLSGTEVVVHEDPTAGSKGQMWSAI